MGFKSEKQASQYIQAISSFSNYLFTELVPCGLALSFIKEEIQSSDSSGYTHKAER